MDLQAFLFVVWGGTLGYAVSNAAVAADARPQERAAMLSRSDVAMIAAAFFYALLVAARVVGHTGLT